MTVFTIGHSTHEPERFLELLRANGITAVADVRSSPYSRLHPQFNREVLRALLAADGIHYVFLGSELGARSEDPACYRDGKVQYDLLAKTTKFQRGIERALEEAARYRLALMCAEKDPLGCHRTILVARKLAGSGVGVEHILEDGSIESHAKSVERLLYELGQPYEDLFRTHEDVIDDAYRMQGEKIAFVMSPAG
jgi:uncharacterized protein (DUF488 family)